MSTRSRDAARLAQLLTEEAGVPVMVGYHGSSRGRYGGWHVEWCDGPTVTTMRSHVTALAPALAPALAGDIRAYDRLRSDLGEAAALLLAVGADPELAGRVGGVVAVDAHDNTEHPEDAGPDTLARARALLSLSPRHVLGRAVMDQLRQRAVTGGWDGVLEWLDGISIGAETPGVVSLEAARRRREQTQ